MWMNKFMFVSLSRFSRGLLLWGKKSISCCFCNCKQLQLQRFLIKYHTKRLWYYCIIRILHPLGQCAATQCSHYLGMFLLSQAQGPLIQERMPPW